MGRLFSLRGHVTHAAFDTARTADFDGHAVSADLGGELDLGPYGRVTVLAQEGLSPMAKHETRFYALLDLDLWF